MARAGKIVLRPIIIVVCLALSSFFALQVYNRMSNPDLDISLNASGIGQAVLDVVVDVLRSLINPERRSF